jgi:hypothetical protein
MQGQCQELFKGQLVWTRGILFFVVTDFSEDSGGGRAVPVFVG